MRRNWTPAPNGLKTKLDMQDHEVEVIYGVNPAMLDKPAVYMIAWERNRPTMAIAWC